MKCAAKLPSPSRGSSSSPPPAHRLSHAIAKAPAPQPKIRIIHVVEAEVIKTEARHFRDLVQRLTGKQPCPKKGSCASSASVSDASPPTSVSSSCDTTAGGATAGVLMKVKDEEAVETSSFPFPSCGEGGGFLRALELDGYNDGLYQELKTGLGHGLEDFVFSSCDMDGAVAGFSF